MAEGPAIEARIAAVQIAGSLWLPLQREPPLAWIERRISLSADPSAATQGHIHIDPYQREPIAAQFDAEVRRVIIMAPEQTGKSTCWRMPVVYKALFMPAPRWIVYESDDKAEDINAESFHPVLEAIPELACMLNRRTAIKRRYQLPNGSIIDFSGAGADITSKARCDAVADELDTWPLPAAEIRRNLSNLAKRLRTFAAQGRGCMVVVSSPKGQHSSIGEEFSRTSREYWYLRCLGCGELTIASHYVKALQWEADDAGEIVADSLRLCCPSCGHEHEEPEASEMNARGAYVARKPAVKDRRGFQWGGLAAPRVMRWLEIARAGADAGRSANPVEQQNFDNSVRGLPWKPRKAPKKQEDAVRAHMAELPEADTLAAVLISADTQDAGWYWVARGIDAAENSYLLGYGMAPTMVDLQAVWDAEYLGITAEAMIIDEGGHRGPEVDKFAAQTPGVYAYKGNTRIGARWKPSNEGAWRLLANPYIYQAELLYLMYSQTKPGANYWYIPMDVGQDYIDHLITVRPVKSVRHGDHYQNWRPQEEDHWFQAEKMWRVLLDFAKDQFRPDNWRAEAGVPAWSKAAARQAAPRKPKVELELLEHE